MKSGLTTYLPVVAALMLAGCGGGGGEAAGGSSAPVLITASAGAAASVDANGGTTVEGSASTTRYPLASLAWKVQAVDPSSASLITSNGDCSVAVKKDTQGVNNGGQAYTSSNWTCKLGVKAGAPKMPQDYTVILTATDSSGNVTSSSTKLTVNAATVNSSGPVSVVAGDPQDVPAGATQALNCLASGGTTTSGKYTWQWVQVSTPDVPLSIANPSTQTTSFVAPAVTAPTQVALECRATDDAATTGKATKLVRLMPSATPAQPVLIANAGAAQVAVPGVRVKLDASGTQWFDAQGKATTGPFINYTWTQVSGPAVTLTNAGASSASFELPSSISSRTTFEFQVQAASVLAATGTAATSEAKVSVVADPAASLGLSLLAPSMAVGRGEAVTLWGLTAGTVGATVYYSWTQVAGPAVALGGGSTASAGFVVPLGEAIGTTYVFRVSAGYQPISASYPGVRSEDMVITVTR